IAYNVNLGTKDLDIAKKIAHQLRAKDGGLTFVKALGFELKERGIVQVSMNLTNYRKSQLFKTYELVRLFADRYGVPVIGSEVVKEGEALRQRLLRLVVEDTEAFDLVMKAFKLSKEQPEARKKAIAEATVKASETPLSTLDCSVRVLRLAREVAEKGTTNALS